MRLTTTHALATIATLIGVAVAAPGFPAMLFPADNPQTQPKIELGRKLFYDKRLSRDGTISCESCHLQQFAFSDGGKRVSKGVGGLEGSRNAPSLGNVGYRKSFFWEGGSPTLELQAIGPLTAHDEMAMEPSDLVAKLSAISEYATAFKQVFSDGVTMLNITRALASFERTLVTNSSAFDRYRAGDANALTPAQERGMELFFGERGECFHCHGGFNFSNEDTLNNGLYMQYKDGGLERISKKPEDNGKFKVPSLRNVVLTAPYMHDGSLKSLQQVLEHYRTGGKAHPSKDPTIQPLSLTANDVNDLILFLGALTDKTFVADPTLAAPKR